MQIPFKNERNSVTDFAFFDLSNLTITFHLLFKYNFVRSLKMLCSLNYVKSDYFKVNIPDCVKHGKHDN